MPAYKRDEMISVTDLLKGFKMTLEKLTLHQLDKVAVMISIDEYERSQSKHYWNRLDEETYLTKAYESLTDTDSKRMSIEELDKKLDETISRYES